MSGVETLGIVGWQAFSYGFIGGFLVELFAIYKLRYRVLDPAVQLYLKSWLFWFLVIFGCALGGGFAYKFAQDNVISCWLALQIGAAWPLIFQRALEATPKIAVESTD